MLATNKLSRGGAGRHDLEALVIIVATLYSSRICIPKGGAGPY
jgi:hypothetical protein